MRDARVSGEDRTQSGTTGLRGIGLQESVRPRPGTEVVGDGGSASLTLRRFLRLLRPWIIPAVLVLGLALVVVFGRSPAAGVPLSPSNPSPAGAQAAAEVLRDHGVTITYPESLAEALSVLDGPEATLLLHDPDGWLNDDQLRKLNGAARVVLIEPTSPVLDALAPDISDAGMPAAPGTAPLRAVCTAEDAQAAETLSPGGAAYRGPLQCFPTPPATDGGGPAASYAATADQDVVVLGNGAILSNGAIEEHGNAALVLRTLGSTPTLIWYQPTPADLATTDTPANPLNLLPPWVNPLMLWLLATALLAVVWRGRRLGPLVTEPLPVVVRAAETAEGRARLYQDSRAVDRAAANLRAGTLMRIAAKLRLPAAGGADAVIDAAARNTGRSRAELDRLLKTATPATDADLVRGAQELDAVEREITPR